eukprot:TRINITY_DN2076_c0_g1_i1.p1 TRINITY_DN2076_c0_g1~~TRINITY_DN2076_c0_g1_i1.p1  ORF type:complete len:202 (-),score=29.93 TRINITY_DN2076_c0_g1_i1:143-748(-)
MSFMLKMMLPSWATEEKLKEMGKSCMFLMTVIAVIIAACIVCFGLTIMGIYLMAKGFANLGKDYDGWELSQCQIRAISVAGVACDARVNFTCSHSFIYSTKNLSIPADSCQVNSLFDCAHPSCASLLSSTAIDSDVVLASEATREWNAFDDNRSTQKAMSVCGPIFFALGIVATVISIWWGIRWKKRKEEEAKNGGGSRKP